MEISKRGEPVADLIHARLATVTALGKAARDVTEAQDALALAVAAATDAATVAMAAGWTAAELRHLGFAPALLRSGVNAPHRRVHGNRQHDRT